MKPSTASAYPGLSQAAGRLRRSPPDRRAGRLEQVLFGK
jgi:hypothetical protein